MTRDQFHTELVKCQLEGLEFHATKYRGLAEMARSYTADALAAILDVVAQNLETALERTRALLTQGSN